MIYGIIYEYLEILTGNSAYIGKAASLYGHEKTLKIVNRRHLRGHDPTPFDFVLRASPGSFEVRIIDRLDAVSASALQEVMKPLEKERVRSRHPRYNCVRFSH